mmetsp:Transcript_42078/g.85913  ORF Transcript_42078/g.85913 Transcript_42078/m.85913 type:complete len:240 (-) Transcript_42078:310-1029(-)
MRRLRVSSPLRVSQAFMGVRHDPRSLSPTACWNNVKAAGPNLSANTVPLYPGSGCEREGNLSFCFQSNFPPSTMHPPMALPCPEMNFVVEWITMSAPCSMGLHRYGVPRVLSTNRGTPTSWAASARAFRSDTTPPGLVRLSTNSPLTLGLARAALTAAISSTSTKSAFHPNFKMVRDICWIVPPYSLLAHTMVSPAVMSAYNAIICAACPQEVQVDATPPSRAAILFCKTSTVGLVKRE